MMKINKIVFDDAFLNFIVNPLSNLTDRGLISIENGNVAKCLAISNTGTSLVFYSEVPVKSNMENCQLPIINIQKFKTLLNYLKSNNIVLAYNNNYLAYSDGDIRFKFYLSEAELIPDVSVSVDKILNFDHGISFDITKDDITRILRLKAINKEFNKFYFILKNDRSISVEFTDKMIGNADMVGFKSEEQYKGTIDNYSFPIDYECLRVISQAKREKFKVKVNIENSVFCFENIENDIKLYYLFPTYIK